MIDFACKTFNIENIIKCSLGLTKSEYKILGFFIDNPENYFTSEEISKELSLNGIFPISPLVNFIFG